MHSSNKDYYEYENSNEQFDPLSWVSEESSELPSLLCIEDDQIETEVNERIHSNPNINLEDKKGIQISVKRGIVTLWGNVKNLISKPLAYIDAFSVYGVSDVNNHIKISPC